MHSQIWSQGISCLGLPGFRKSSQGLTQRGDDGEEEQSDCSLDVCMGWMCAEDVCVHRVYVCTGCMCVHEVHACVRTWVMGVWVGVHGCMYMGG